MGMLDRFISHCNAELQDWNSVSLVGGEHYSSIIINWMSHGITTWIYPDRVPFTKSINHLAGRTTGTCSTIANYSARAKKKSAYRRMGLLMAPRNMGGRRRDGAVYSSLDDLNGDT